MCEGVESGKSQESLVMKMSDHRLWLEAKTRARRQAKTSRDRLQSTKMETLEVKTSGVCLYYDPKPSTLLRRYRAGLNRRQVGDFHCSTISKEICEERICNRAVGLV